MKPETNPKKTKAKKLGTNSTHYLIHVYEDKEMLKHIKSIANVPQDKTKAHKLFKSVIIDDTTLNKYYYYELVEQTFKSVELYPTPPKKKYNQIEQLFLQEAINHQMTPADLDLTIWKSYATKI